MTAGKPGHGPYPGVGHRSGLQSWLTFFAILLLVLPLTISGVYMWAMYDPAKSLRSVDLAVVNQDEGFSGNNYGASVVEGLFRRDYLSFKEVSAEDAQQGVNYGTYLFAITIPPDFSRKVETLTSEQPDNPDIFLDLNGFNGTNGAFLTSSLIPEIQLEISEAFTEAYATRLIDGVNQLGGGLHSASDGATQIDDGMRQLDDGLVQALAGADQLNDGAAQLHDGTTRLVGGTTQLDTGAGQLVDAMKQLGDGATQIDEGVGELTAVAIPSLHKAQQIADQLRPVPQALRAAGSVAEAERLEALLLQLDSSNPENLVSQLTRLKDGTATVAYMLSDPTSPYHAGMLALEDGIGQVHDGATQINDGTAQLKDGTSQLHSGTVQLKDGATRLKDGTGQLATGLADGAARAPIIPNIAESSKQVASPVNMVKRNAFPTSVVVNPADPTVKRPSSGASLILVIVFGFLFMAIATMLLPRLSNLYRRTASSSAVVATLARFGELTAVGLVILSVLSVTAFFFGWKPASVPALALDLVLMAAASAAINQMLRISFGRLFGGLSMLALYVLGMFSFGGVWPLATVPRIFQALHLFTPLTPGRDAFIAATYGAWVVKPFLSLALFTLIPLAISLMVRARRARILHRGRIATSDSDTFTHSELSLVN